MPPVRHQQRLTDIGKGELIVLSKTNSHGEISRELGIPRLRCLVSSSDSKRDIHPTIFPTLVDQEKHPTNSIDGLSEQH